MIKNCSTCNYADSNDMCWHVDGPGQCRGRVERLLWEAKDETKTSCTGCWYLGRGFCPLRCFDAWPDSASVNHSLWRADPPPQTATEVLAGSKPKQGTKHDNGKLKLDLIPPEIIEMLGEVFQYGSGKYGRNNWEKGFADDRLIAAALRHYVEYAKGNRYDEDSGLPHLAQAAWNLLILETLKRRKDNDK